jgi:ferrochelatase
MRYTRPRAADALDQMVEAGVDRLVALTLYPQYSKATTGSSLADLERTMARKGIDLPLTVIDRFPTHPGYLQAMATNIRAAIQACPVKARRSVVLLFSAHSLPQRFIDEGDPYLAETIRTVDELRKLVPKDQPWRLGFQSRSGPVKWVGPDTEEVITELGVGGRKDVIVVPVSFVSDHIETLYEVDMLYGDQARKLGIKGYRRSESLNDSPAFLAALADLVEEALL